MCSSPVATVDVEHYDDEAQAVTGQVRAAKEPGDSPSTMFPSGHLTNDRDRIEDVRQWGLPKVQTNSYVKCRKSTSVIC